MAVVARRIFVDTSVFVRGLIEIGPDDDASQFLDVIAEGRLGQGHTAWHCCLEFYSISTRLPEEFRLTPADAFRLIDEEVLARFTVHQLPDRSRREFLRTASQERIAGGRVYDSHIAETARNAKADAVVTENPRHFTSLMGHGIQVMTAAEFCSSIG